MNFSKCRTRLILTDVFHGSIPKRVLQWGWSYPTLGQGSKYMRSLHCCCLYLPTPWIFVFNIPFRTIKCTATYKANPIASSYLCFVWWLPEAEEWRLFSVLWRVISSSDFWSQVCCTEMWFGANISVHWKKNLNTDAMVLIKSEMQILSHSFLNFFLDQGLVKSVVLVL